MHPAALDIDQLLKDCDVRRTRRSGPGGQHRNKVETAVVITHKPTDVAAEASERRSQEANRQVAIRRLRLRLAIDVRLPVEADQSPSPLWRSRCRGRKISVNPEHDDFPTLLAEALDVLATHDWEAKPAAEQLTCTSSQIIKLLEQEPQAFARLNRERQSRGLHPLK